MQLHLKTYIYKKLAKYWLNSVCICYVHKKDRVYNIKPGQLREVKINCTADVANRTGHKSISNVIIY